MHLRPMHQTSTSESVCDQRAAASHALFADPSRLPRAGLPGALNRAGIVLTGREAGVPEDAAAEAGALLGKTSLLDVRRLLAGGRDNAEIAAELFISPSTAKSNVSRFLGKLRSENRIQAAVYAVQCGLV